MPIKRCPFYLILLIGLASPIQPLLCNPANYYHYQLTTDQALTTLTVNACFNGIKPKHLIAESELAPSALVSVNKLVIDEPWSSNIISLRGIKGTGCIEYQVDLNKLPQNIQKANQSIYKAKLVPNHFWLWLPGFQDQNTHIDITFKLPKGMDVSCPWQRIKQTDNEIIYRLNDTPHEWLSMIAIGELKRIAIEINQANIELAIPNTKHPVNHADITNWVQSAALGLKKIYGTYPNKYTQILVLPIDIKNSAQTNPVPWGQVTRGGYPAIQLFINQSRPLQDLLNDWTIYHEFSHMLLPLLKRQDAWISEGIASYYQHIVQAKSGVVNEQEAWQKILQGFQRGLDNSKKTLGITLSDASKNMHKLHSYRRVYWSGAAYALLVDLELRNKSNNKKSLATTLSDFNQCCMPSNTIWSAQKLLKKFDELSQTQLFTEHYIKLSQLKSFPNLEPSWAKLGIEYEHPGLKLNQDAPMAKIRSAILLK